MTLKYFEGFDIQTTITGHNVLNVADTDTWYNWRVGTLSSWRPEFREGYQGGGSIRVNEYMTSAAQASIDGQTRVRIGFWGTGTKRTEFLTANKTFLFLGTQFQDIKGFHIRALENGTLELRDSILGTIYATTAVVCLTDEGIDQSPNDFHYYEVYAESDTGDFQMWRDGDIIIDTSIGPLSGPFVEWTFGHPPSELVFPKWDAIIDHLWMTDGDPLPDQDVLGVVINASHDSYTSNGRGFRGTMIIDGERYVTEWDKSATSSSVTQFGHNICTTVPYFWFNYPVDESVWSSSKYDAIESWGVCFAPSDVPTPGMEARLDALCISRLMYNGGEPKVLYERPASVAQFSGTWRKSNPELSYFAHVNDIPRDDVLDSDDSKSLYTGELGCILFGKAPPVDEDEDPLLETFGITFAEEYREDYTDFLRVDGEGTDYLSYAVSGYSVYGQSDKKFQSNYVTVNAEEVTNGGAYIQGLWDYTVDRDTGRWSMKQQVYRLDHDGHRHFAAKLKMRGSGRAFQIRLESQTGKPFAINGWAVLVSSNTNV